MDSGQPKLKRQKQTNKQTKNKKRKKEKRRVKVSQILANHILTYQITVPHQKKKKQKMHTPGSMCGQWTTKVKKTKTNQKKKKSES